MVSREICERSEKDLSDVWVPICPPRVDSSKVCLLDHNGKWVKQLQVLHSFGPWKKLPNLGSKIVSRLCFLLIRTLPTCWTLPIWIFILGLLLIFGISRFPDIAGRTLKSQPDPCHNAPRDQIGCKVALAVIFKFAFVAWLGFGLGTAALPCQISPCQ